MIRVPRARTHRIDRRPQLKKGPKLPPPHYRAVVDVIPSRSVVMMRLGHLIDGQLLRQILVRKRAPAVVIGVLVDELLVEARRGNPAVEQDVVLATQGSGLLHGAAAGHEFGVRGDVVGFGEDMLAEIGHVYGFPFWWRRW